MEDNAELVLCPGSHGMYISWMTKRFKHNSFRDLLRGTSPMGISPENNILSRGNLLFRFIPQVGMLK